MILTIMVLIEICLRELNSINNKRKFQYVLIAELLETSATFTSF